MPGYFKNAFAFAAGSGSRFVTPSSAMASFLFQSPNLEAVALSQTRTARRSCCPQRHAAAYGVTFVSIEDMAGSRPCSRPPQRPRLQSTGGRAHLARVPGRPGSGVGGRMRMRDANPKILKIRQQHLCITHLSSPSEYRPENAGRFKQLNWRHYEV